MKKKEDLRILKTKASLYRGLMSLMKTKPFENIKISEICSISLINRSTFYDHFNDKLELIESLMNDMKNELIDSLSFNIDTDNIKDYYMEIIKLLLDHINININIYSAVAKINSNSIARDMMTDAVITSVTKEIDSNFINKSSIPTRSIVLFYASGIINVIIENLNTGANFDIDNLLNTINKLLPNLDFFIKK